MTKIINKSFQISWKGRDGFEKKLKGFGRTWKDGDCLLKEEDNIFPLGLTLLGKKFYIL